MKLIDIIQKDIDQNVKNVTLDKDFHDRLSIILEHDTYDGPTLCVNFTDDANYIYDIDCSDGHQEVEPTMLEDPESLIRMMQVLNVITKYSKYWQTKVE